MFERGAQDGQQSRGVFYLKLAAIGLPTLYLLKRISAHKEEDYRTDFDGFLKKQEEKGSTGSNKSNKNKGLDGGSIDGFFKDSCADTRNPVDFNSFLKSNAKPQPAASVAEKEVKVVEKKLQAHHVRIPIFFGTEFGFSKEIAEKLSETLSSTNKFWPVIYNMGQFPRGYDFGKEQLVIMTCSTQGDGVPPSEAREFCEWVFGGAGGASLSSLSFAVLALGDKSYAHFCRCGRQLDESLGAAGGARLLDRVDVHREDWRAVDQWIENLRTTLDAAPLKTVGELGLTDAEEPAATAAAAAESSGPRWDKKSPFPATTVAIDGLCRLAADDSAGNCNGTCDRNGLTADDDKVTVRGEFDLGDSGLEYLPGDALGIYPSNEAEAVSELLALLGCTGDETVQPPSWCFELRSRPVGGAMTLREALTWFYDLRTPRASLLDLLEKQIQGDSGSDATAAAQLERLRELRAASSDAQQRFWDERHVVDVLLEFRAAKLTWQKLLSSLRALQPRLYSISSSPLEGAAKVQVTVAEVRYSSLGRERHGVCSTLISSRIKAGDAAYVYIHRNPDFRLPEDPATPIVMVGPGTGLAPFRSFILHRMLGAAASGAAAPSAANTVLFFGCRRRDQDYLYGDVLESWAADGAMQLHTAFSREKSGEKVYVQARLREQAAAVWQLLSRGGAHFYVCGDGARMAVDVEKVLLEDVIGAGLVADAVVAEGEDVAAAARSYLDNLATRGRYQRDVWC